MTDLDGRYARNIIEYALRRIVESDSEPQFTRLQAADALDDMETTLRDAAALPGEIYPDPLGPDANPVARLEVITIHLRAMNSGAIPRTNPAPWIDAGNDDVRQLLNIPADVETERTDAAITSVIEAFNAAAATARLWWQS